MTIESVTLLRDCHATLIPVGDEITLAKGTKYQVTQALGGSVTLRDATALYRIEPEELDALGEELMHRVLAANEVSGESDDKPFGEDRVWDALRGCFDPEIPINLVDLGLIYDLRLEKGENDQYEVAVKMTLTAQGCGMGPVIAQDAKNRIEKIPEVDKAEVEIIWDPPWSPRMISEEGKKVLGLT